MQKNILPLIVAFLVTAPLAATYQSGSWYWDEPYFIGGSGGTQRGFGTQPGEGTRIVRDAMELSAQPA